MSAMDEIRQTFFEECTEQMAELEAGLLAIENGETDSETVNAVFRAVHSIKGGAGAFNLNDLVAFAHIFETTLDELRSGRLAFSPEVNKVMLRSADVLADLIAAARDDGAVDAERSAGLAEELKALVTGRPLPPAATAADKLAASPFGEGDGMDGLDFRPVAIAFDDIFGSAAGVPRLRIRFKPHAMLYAKANDGARLLRECLALGDGTVSCDISGVPLLNDLDPEDAYLAWTVELTTDRGESAVREIFEFVEDDCDLSIEAVADAPDMAASAINLDPELAALLARVQADGGDREFAAEPPSDFALKVDFEPPAAPSPAAIEAVERPFPAEQAKPAAVASGDGPAEAKAGGHAPPPATIRVDLERVDRLIDLVGELVIHQVMLSQRAIQAGLARASEMAVGLDELEQLTREIQDSVMAIRAQPVKSVFQKLPRLVREVADITGKQVRLVTEGEYTEVDKTVIERLSDPLTHMIRNAIDHGIEKPDRRLEAGKPEEGTVRVAAMHRSGRIVIEISDDGAGINRRVVQDIAVNKGLVPASANLTDEEIDNLIFLPGFSTQTQVSQLSGRGVGMDVVKRSIQALGGRVSIASRPGQGSMFTMSLPLTLAVLDGMIVSAGAETLVVPLTAIIETLKPKPADIRPFGSDGRLINVRDKFLPLIDIAYQLGYSPTLADPMTGVTVLVEAENGSRSALLFDAIQGQRQVVIKSLEANYGRIPGIAAATILGDGRVALILDVDVLTAARFENAFNNTLQAAE
jgi:two-component system, chemotaxis family, sensor kinase CheA